MHAARAEAHVAHAEGREEDASPDDALADAWQERALAAEERVDAARHKAAAEGLATEGTVGEAPAHTPAAREREARARDERIRRRLARRQQPEQGLGRLRPGAGSTL